jgi:hypothetical protein
MYVQWTWEDGVNLPFVFIKLQKKVKNELQWTKKYFKGLWKCNKVGEGIEKVYIAFEDISKPL